MAAPIVTAIKSISAIIKAVSTIRQMLGGTAPDTITTADLDRVVRGENARFFTTIAFAEIETIHNQFYHNWLPSVANRAMITADDINLPNGALFHIFPELIKQKGRLGLLMNQVREVFRSYSGSLHVDELVGGVLSCMHGYGLLLHIHGVYAELRRIQIGAASLGDPDLLTDTRAALVYVSDGQAALTMFLRSTPTMNETNVETRRLAHISAVTLAGSAGNPGYWTFNDSYRPLSSAPSYKDLSGPKSQYPNGNKGVIDQQRVEHVQKVGGRMELVFSSAGNDVLAEYSGLWLLLYQRRIVQEGGTIVYPPTESPPINPWSGVVFNPGKSESEEGSDAQVVETETDDHRKDFLDVPVGADEFIALSHKLRRLDYATSP